MRLCFTFLGEKILGIFAGHYEFAWDTPQQLNDQRYVVYRRFQEEREQKTDRQDTQQIVRQSPGHRPTLGVCGWRAEGGQTVVEVWVYRPTVRNHFIKHGHQTLQEL